jgi:anti-sigma regulatory factor (Ser/Thr protein kinase)
MAHRIVRALVAEGRLLREGAGPSSRYRDAGSLPLTFRYPASAIAEDRVWAEILAACPTVARFPERGRTTLEYMFTEMLNNAIEHARAKTIDIRIESVPGGLAFEIRDNGIGIFWNLRRRLGFKSDLEALQALSKGKLTTEPDHHTGEGIFFTSKAARRFEIESGDVRWIVDNTIGDVAVGVAARRKGTRVNAVVAARPARPLSALFAEYTEGFAFSRTRIVVKLFAVGVRFISRSQARRLLRGLERFRHVVLDFKGVDAIGQGFADEVFRVWANAQHEVRIDCIQMAPPVAFMVNRARPSRID